MNVYIILRDSKNVLGYFETPRTFQFSNSSLHITNFGP